VVSHIFISGLRFTDLANASNYCGVMQILPGIFAALHRGMQPRFGNGEPDFRKAEVSVGGREVELSAKELQLLRYFLEHPGATLSRQELLDAVWGWNAMPVTRTVDVHVAGLRKKLEKDARTPSYIVTMHGLGYKFVAELRDEP
jgi:DNA-binding response OmpR family regulator